MPTTSERHRLLEELRKGIRHYREKQSFNILMDLDPFDVKDLLAAADLEDKFNRLASERYFCRNRTYRCGNSWQIFQEDLVESSRSGCWLNDFEFKLKYGMLRESFWKLHDLIKGHQVFRVAGTKRSQMPSEYQLLVLLAFLRTEGDGMSDKKSRALFRLSSGAAKCCKERVAKAIVELLYSKTVFWPDEEERREISRRFQSKYQLPNLVGVVDGTLFPLAFRPSRTDASDFHGRKHLYSLSTIIVNDDLKRIRYFNAGWAGCTHDDRILSNSSLCNNAELMFSPMQYIIGDCAFAARWFVVPCFKKPPGRTLPREKEIFNKTLAKPPVTSEHVNGLLKNRFPFLRSIRFRLTDDKESMKRILTYITVVVILHNLLIGFGDEGEVGDEEVSDIDDENELNRAIPNVTGQSALCREQLKKYIMENYHL